MPNTKNITLVQMTMILISSILGVSVLRLPLIAVRAAETGGPFVTILAIFVSFLGLGILVKLGTRFPNQSFIQYNERIVGKWIGRLYGVIVLLFFVVFTGFAAREFGAVATTSLLIETPIEVTILLLLTLAATFTRDDLNTFAYIHNFFLPLLLLPALLIVGISLKNANPLYLRPVFTNGSGEMIIGILTIVALVQIGFIVTIIIPAMQKPQKAVTSFVWGMLISGSVFIFLVIAGLSIFGHEELKKIMWPILELSRATSIPGEILGRLDAIFLAVWVTAVFTTVFSSYMIVVQLFKQLFHLQSHKLFSFFILPFIFVVAMMPNNVTEMYQTIAIAGRWGLIITMLFPAILLLIAIIRNVSGEKGEE